MVYVSESLATIIIGHGQFLPTYPMHTIFHLHLAALVSAYYRAYMIIEAFSEVKTSHNIDKDYLCYRLYKNFFSFLGQQFLLRALNAFPNHLL
jgi:hypothetical protein